MPKYAAVVIFCFDKEPDQPPAASYHPLADLVFQLTVKVTTTNTVLQCTPVLRHPVYYILVL